MNERLILVRKDHDMTQEAFAARLNLSKSHVSSLEVGRRPITDRIIYDICREFGISEDWLRDGKGEMYRALDTDYALAAEIGSLLKSDDSWTKKAVLQFLKLPPDQKQAIKNFLAGLNFDE